MRNLLKTIKQLTLIEWAIAIAIGTIILGIIVNAALDQPTAKSEADPYHEPTEVIYERLGGYLSTYELDDGTFCVVYDRASAGNSMQCDFTYRQRSQ